MSEKSITPTKPKRDEPKEFVPRTERQRLMVELKKRYHVHFNEIKGRPEFCLKGEEGGGNITQYNMIDEYAVNSIINTLDSETDLRRVSSDTIFSVVNSDFVPLYHPVKGYFRWLEKSQSFKQIEGTKHIKQLAATLNTTQNETFVLALEKWMISSVAQVFEGDDVLGKNQTAIVLCSDGHGIGKTSWIAALCPHCLRKDYYFQGKIRDLDSNEMPVLLAEKFILNIDDQFHNLVKKDNNTMKTYIAHGKLTMRRTYARYNVELPRLANFIGSINGNKFMDDEANRRYYPFTVISVDWQTLNTLDVDFAWAEAYNQYRQYKKTREEKYRYWWTTAEIEQHFGDMSEYKTDSMELQLFLQYYEPCTAENQSGQYLTNTQILIYIQNNSGVRNLSDKKLGSALKRLHCYQTRRKINGVSNQVYKVRQRTLEEFERTINDTSDQSPPRFDSKTLFDS